MFITNDIENRIMKLVSAIGSSVSTYMIGRDLGQNYGRALASAAGLSKQTMLEQAYMAGRVATAIGPDKLKTMSPEEVEAWISDANLRPSDEDQAKLKAMRSTTEKWISGRTDAWQQKIKTALAKADSEWRGALMQGSMASAEARTTARNAALDELVGSLKNEGGTYEAHVDRLLQTELHSYFQQGQVAGVSGDQYVYKIPRSTACPTCMYLHLNGDGSPKMYLLEEVVGNSNWGQPAYAWDFVVGPTHPYCYCILHTAGEDAPGPNETRAKARMEKLTKSQSETWERNTLDMLGPGTADEPIPEHQLVIMGVLREMYGDDPLK